MCKANRAYRDVAVKQKLGGRNIWTLLPNYFKETQKEMAEATNSLENFLGSGVLTFNPEYYVHRKTFVAAMNEHLQVVNYRAGKLNKDTVAGPFQNRGLRLDTSATKRRYPRDGGELVSGPFIMGCDLADAA